MSKKNKSARYGKARSKGKRTPINRESKNIYGTKTPKIVEEPIPKFLETPEQIEEFNKEVSKIPIEYMSGFLIETGEYGGYKLDMDYILSYGLGDIMGNMSGDKKKFYTDKMDSCWRRGLAPTINKLFARNRETTKENIYEVSKNILFVNGLERKQSTLDVPDMLGVFATKKYKKGDKLTKYPIHCMTMPKIGDDVPGESWFEEEYKESTGTAIFMNPDLYDEEKIEKERAGLYLPVDHMKGFLPYAIGFTGVGTIYGDPRPFLNQNSNYWGHLINDGVYRPGLSSDMYRSHNKEGIGFNCKWEELNIFATKDIECGEELLLCYGSQYWYNTRKTPRDKIQQSPDINEKYSRDELIRKGTYTENSDQLPPINYKNAAPAIPVLDSDGKPIGHIAKISCLDEKFLLLNQTKDGYDMLMGVVEELIESNKKSRS